MPVLNYYILTKKSHLDLLPYGTASTTLTSLDSHSGFILSVFVLHKTHPYILRPSSTFCLNSNVWMFDVPSTDAITKRRMNLLT